MKQGVCEVHKLVYNDSSIKEVEYCNTCKAWICRACKYNIPARTQAFAKSLGNKLFGK